MCSALKNKLVILFLLLSSIISAQTPIITSFTPTTICQGEEVTITGTNFTDATAVQLGSAAAKSFKVVNSTTITAIVADDASTGKIKVTTPKGDATSDDNITINPTPEPELEDVSPGSHPQFSNCNRSLSYTITVKNISKPKSNSCNYDIDWGDNSTH